MTTTLEDEYPEGAQYIQEAVATHGEAWVLENYYEQLYPLGVLMKMPEKEELPFYDEDEHETMTEEERVEMYQAWAEYRDNLRTGTKPGECGPPHFFLSCLRGGTHAYRSRSRCIAGARVWGCARAAGRVRIGVRDYRRPRATQRDGRARDMESTSGHNYR